MVNRKKIVKYSTLGIGGILFIIVLLLLSLRFYFVQQFVMQQVTKYLSRVSEAQVEVGRVRLTLFDNLILDHVLVKDTHQDTLFYSEKVRIAFNSNLFGLLAKKLDIGDIYCTNAQLNVKRRAGELLDNLQTFLAAFERIDKEEKKETSPSSFSLNIRRVNFNKLTYSKLDSVKGNYSTLLLPRGNIRVRELSLQDKRLVIEKADFYRPKFNIITFEYDSVFYQTILPPVISDSLKLEQVPNNFAVQINKFNIDEGTFKFDNNRLEPIRLTPDSILNYNHLHLKNINLTVNSFYHVNDTYTGSLECLGFYDLSGFQLDQLLVSQWSISNQEIALQGMLLETPNTSIGDTLIFRFNQFSDFEQFNDRVKMRLAIKDGSKVKLSDVMTFAPMLQKDAFFRLNQNNQIDIQGVIDGTVNNLDGNDLVIQLDKNASIRASFDAKNLTNPEITTMIVKFDALESDIRTLKRILPNFSLPQNFNKLGKIKYRGTLSFIFGDLIIGGRLNSNLGIANLDIRFNEINAGLEKAKYSGELVLKEFNLGAWTNDSNFGKISLEAFLKEGKGLTGKTADATLVANVGNFEYRKYRYQNANFEGRLSQQLFKGNLSISDEHVQLDFIGELDFTTSTPNFDFKLAVEKIDLQPLNLYAKPLTISGQAKIDLELRDNELTKSEGSAMITNLQLQNEFYKHKIQSIGLRSKFENGETRSITINSDLLNATLEGKYELNQIANGIKNYAFTHFPAYARKVGIDSLVTDLRIPQIRCNVEVLNTGTLTQIFIPKLDTLQHITLNAAFDGNSEILDVMLNIPKLRYDSINFFNIYLSSDFERNEGSVNFGLDSIVLKNDTRFEATALIGDWFGDSLSFNFNYAPIASFKYKFNIDGLLTPLDSTMFRIALDTTNLNLLGTTWDLSPNNFIHFGDSTIQVGNFNFRDRNKRQISLESYEDKGLVLMLNQFDLNLIDSLWKNAPLGFSGRYRLAATAKDIFKLQDLSFFLDADSLFINKDHWGKLQLNAFAENLNSTISAFAKINKESNKKIEELQVTGYYNPQSYDPEKSRLNVKMKKPNYFDVGITTYRYPLRLLEYFLVGASDIKGVFDADIKLSGQPDKPDVAGKVKIDEAALTVDFLKTRYFIDNQQLVINNRRIDVVNGVIKDEMGNSAFVKGGLTHNRLKNLGLALELTAERFLAMNTTKKDNSAFYGRGIGSGKVTFLGSFEQTNIVVRARADRGTKITIPVSATRDGSKVSFIRFVDANGAVKQEEEKKVISETKGVDLALNLSLTDLAEVELIFDEQAGDILRGRGNGDLQIYLNRAGEMSMYGNYTVQSGEYLFTLFNLVNKPFVVEQGGKIQWRGDPLNATIDIAAKYKDLNTAIANLIPEYLSFVSPDTRNRASQQTSVDLTMYLKGELFKPLISFDLNFPRLQGDLRTYADNKLRTLRLDQNELNKQVFGLIVLGQFIPSDFSLSGQSGGDITINTVSELLANQLSILVTDFFLQVFDDSNVISNVDFDIAYSRYKNEVDFTQDNFFIYGEAIGVRQKTSLFDERFTLIIGGNRTSAATATSSRTALGGDIVVEAFLNKERTLKLRAYSIFEPSIIGGNDTKVGTGLSYRKEFNSFRELFQSLFKRDTSKIQK